MKKEARLFSRGIFLKDTIQTLVIILHETLVESSRLPLIYFITIIK